MREQTRVPKPSSFIFTLYGDMVHRLNPHGALPIGALIRLMAPFGISPAAVRQAVSRMTAQGWLASERRARRALYAVTARGRERIEQLSPRIYGPVVEWDGRWRILVYAIPERERRHRDRLRKELTVLGWAPLTASAWLSLADSTHAARQAAEAIGVSDAVHAFCGEYRGPLSDRVLLARCWDVDAIADRYRAFIEWYRPLVERERTRHALDDEAAFAERLWLVHDFRKFAYLDPGLPSELLSAHWPGSTAAALFREHYAQVERKSQRYFRAVTESNGA
jgi:phenylacetic acid degradation operon negative regulatory protein